MNTGPTAPTNRFPCPRCEAASRDGKTCLDKHHEILAVEYEDPAVFGAGHHMTVTCYNLQHPDFFLNNDTVQVHRLSSVEKRGSEYYRVKKIFKQLAGHCPKALER